MLEAVNQIVVHGYSVLDVSQRLGVSTKSLYDWQKTFSKPRAKREADKDLQAENARLKRELKRAQQERDTLKEAVVLCRRVKERYPFIKARSQDYSVRTRCRAMETHPSGYYEWLRQPLSNREAADMHLTNQIKQYWLESDGHSGYRNIHLDLAEAKIVCGRDRVLKLMRQARLQSAKSSLLWEGPPCHSEPARTSV